MATSIAIPAGFRVLSLPIAQLNLAAVLKCGQSFRWHSIPLNLEPATAAPILPDREWRLSLKDRVICLRQSPTTLMYRAVFPSGTPGDEDSRDASTLAWLRDYFQLDIDLVKLYDQWSMKDKVFHGVRDRFCGIRMLRQDPWENVVSFICSQNNHISRITNMVQSLCTHFSPKLVTVPSDDASPEARTYHAFPPPEALSDPSVDATLRSLGFGYRAKYIQKTAAFLCETHKDPEAWLLSLRLKGVDEARVALLELSGVGPKVADCILLMSLDKAAVVPVDTHVYQIAVKHYGLRGSSSKPSMTPALYSQVATKLMGVWGDYAGWAHSVLFTADLKSFADYGLPSPAPSVAPTIVGESPSSTPTKRKQKLSISEPSASPSPTKRSRTIVECSETSALLEATNESSGSALTLIERVKSRRRTSTMRV